MEAWGETPIRVRMGLHTGSAELHGNDYRGYLTLAKAQRVMSVAYGGQVLLSNASAELLHDQLPSAITLRNMMEHHLKGLPGPERLWQLITQDLPQNFPPLPSLIAIPNNLPIQLTTFIGREKELEQIKKRLQKNRLVTLTGSGGIGKTRLSIQVASDLLGEYPNGVWLVELAPVTNPSLVTQAVCTALDMTPQGMMSALSALVEFMRSKKMLLVVDNCEHLIDSCAQLAGTLLQACPELRILTSSREALGIDGESAYRVPSLSLADPHGGLKIIEQSEAVLLFVERARAILPGYSLTEANAPIIAQICERLDGIALAIELAASRVNLLRVDQVAARLDDAFRLLTGGSRTALPRQQTLRGTIDWSYNLVTEEERRMLRWFSVFVGGWTLEAAEAICEKETTLELLVSLVDKSLVAVDREHVNEARYYLLETIRQYAREKLTESGEGEQIRGRHLHYFLKLGERAEPELYGAQQVEWLHRLEDEHENLRAALEWSLREDIPAGQQLAAALFWSWSLRGHLSEGYDWLERVLAVSSNSETVVRAKLLSGIGWLAAMLGYRERSIALSEESVDLFRRSADKDGLAFSLLTIAFWAYRRSDYEQAAKLCEESRALYAEAGNTWGIRHAVGILGYNAEAQGNFDLAQKHYEESLALASELEDKDGIGWTYYLMGRLARLQGDTVRARKLLEEGLRFARETMSKPQIGWILTIMGQIAIGNGEYESARKYLEEGTEVYRKMGHQASVASSLQLLGWVARLQDDQPKSQSVYRESLQLVHGLGKEADIAECLIGIGQLLGTRGSLEKFARVLGMAERAVPDIQKMLDPILRTETEKFIKTAQSTLGDEAYTAALEAGKQTSLEEAIAFARKELQQ
jgi:predicted ATPase